MRISELSRASGVPLATVKYYLREGLLPAGEPTGATQARYSPEHVARLRLVRALVEVGGLSIASVRQVLAALSADPQNLHEALGAAHGALPPRVAEPVDPTEARELVRRLGWRVHDGAPALRQLARALGALRDAGLEARPEVLEAYAAAARSVAAVDVAGVPADSPEAAARHAVLGTVLFEPVLLALRRLAQEDASARRFAG